LKVVCCHKSELLSNTLYANTPTGLKIYKVQIYETPNCYTTCILESISDNEKVNWAKVRFNEVKQYADAKGILEYDDRKIDKAK
jgi:hypothetical protein